MASLKHILYAVMALSLTLCQKSLAQQSSVSLKSDSAGASTMNTNGSLGVSYTVSSSNYALTGANCQLSWNGTANGTATLPAAVSGAGNFKGRMYYIKNITSGYTLTIAASGAELIDNQSGTNAASITLQPGGYCVLVSKGTASGATWEAAVVGKSNYMRPYFSAVRSSITPGAGGVSVTGYTELADDRNNFDPTTGLFTAPEDGYYLFSYATTLAASAGGVVAQRLSTGSSVQRVTITPASSYNQAVASSYCLKMAKGSTVSFFVAFAVSTGSGITSESFSGLKLE